MLKKPIVITQDTHVLIEAKSTNGFVAYVAIPHANGQVPDTDAVELIGGLRHIVTCLEDGAKRAAELPSDRQGG